MADVEYDSGDEWHDGGWELDELDDLTLKDVERALSEWGDYDEVLVDIEGDEDFYS